MTQDGPNSPWVMTLQEVAYHPCIPQNWYDLAKGTLGGSQYVKWAVFFKEAYRTQAEFNRVADFRLQIHITYLMLTGKGFSTGVQQAEIEAPYWDQVKQTVLDTWLS